MKVVISLSKFYLLLAFLGLVCFMSVSCNDEEENAPDIAVTGKVETYGCTFADIKGFVNFDLLPGGNGDIEIGIEYDYLKSGNQIIRKTKVTSLVNGNFVAKISNLPSSTEIRYRTYVKSSGLTHYGKYLSFKTKGMVNVVTTGEATDIDYTSAKLSASVQSVSADEREKFSVGIACSISASALHPDSMYYVAKEYVSDEVISEYTLSFTNLLEGVTYYYAAFTTDGENYKLSQIKDFTTKGIWIPRSGAVDLGLSVKWAAYNVGASSPEEYGGYYSWGETREKSVYNSSTYKYNNKNIGTDISGTQYDVARVKWGSNWRMPTFKEFNELREKCTWQSYTFKRVKGELVTGPNGNKIFLPLSGIRDGQDFILVGSNGRYWTSTLSEYNENYASIMFIEDNSKYWTYYYLYGGLSIRPVCE